MYWCVIVVRLEQSHTCFLLLKINTLQSYMLSNYVVVSTTNKKARFMRAFLLALGLGFEPPTKEV